MKADLLLLYSVGRVQKRGAFKKQSRVLNFIKLSIKEVKLLLLSILFKHMDFVSFSYRINVFFFFFFFFTCLKSLKIGKQKEQFSVNRRDRIVIHQHIEMSCLSSTFLTLCNSGTCRSLIVPDENYSN